MDKDLYHNIFESLRGIKHELYAERFQVNELRETYYLLALKTHVLNLTRDEKRHVTSSGLRFAVNSDLNLSYVVTFCWLVV